MKVLELFAGTRSIGKAFEARGHEVFSVEWDKQFENIDLYADVLTVTAAQIIEIFGKPDVIWASPDCTTYSVAAISKHRRKEANGNLAPVSEYAKFCDKVNAHVVNLIRELNPRFWFIENPVGGLRKMDFMQGLPRHTVTYCQYGERRQKPTDIWTNHPDPQFKPPCKRGMPCHDAAPRGSQTGTQALKNAVEKSRIPVLLCEMLWISAKGGLNRMFYSDDPVRDFERHDREQQRRLGQLPKCDKCHKPIQDEYLFDIYGEILCEKCVIDKFRKDVDHG